MLCTASLYPMYLLGLQLLRGFVFKHLLISILLGMGTSRILRCELPCGSYRPRSFQLLLTRLRSQMSNPFERLHTQVGLLRRGRITGSGLQRTITKSWVQKSQDKLFRMVLSLEHQIAAKASRLDKEPSFVFLKLQSCKHISPGTYSIYFAMFLVHCINE